MLSATPEHLEAFPPPAGERDNLPPFVQSERLNIAYGAHTALEDVSLSLPENRISAVIGPSGCGKSSFLKCINRLTDLNADCQVSGRLLIDGEDVLAPSADVIDVRRKVGMIFQRPNPFPFSIRANLMLALREAGVQDRHERERRMVEVLQSVGLWDEVKDRLKKSAVYLSGGQQQRLCIARALLLEPRVLLMDEPCSALDPMSSQLVEDLIASLCSRCTIIIVTHNLAQAQRISERCAFFWNTNGAGCLVECGPTRQIFHYPRNEITQAYIEGRVA